VPNPYRIPIGGSWGLDNLAEFPRTYSQVYSVIHSLRLDADDSIAERREMAYTAFPWRGGYSAINFYFSLYHLIPSEDQPRVRAILYSSPGHIDLALVLASAIAIRLISTQCLRVGRELHDLYDHIHKSLSQRRLLSLEVKSKELQLSREEFRFVEESSEQLAQLMGFRDLEALRAYTNNPLAALKILLSFYRRVQILMDYESKGLATLSDSKELTEQDG
jgi:hypothetical protein